MAANAETGIEFKVRVEEDLPRNTHVFWSPGRVTYQQRACHFTDLRADEPPFVSEEQVVVTTVVSARMHEQRLNWTELHLNAQVNILSV